MKICYILSYRCPDYVRTRTLLSALKQLEDVEVFEAMNTSKGIVRYMQTVLSLFWIRIKRNPECYILGFRGYEIFWIVRFITLRRTLIFDHMMSPYDSLVNERKWVKKGGILDRLIYFYEKLILKYSDNILTDTALHKTFFVELFKIMPGKVFAIPVGADEDVFRKESFSEREKKRDVFTVLYYGSFLPLHGMDTILKAANLLRELPILFTVIGGSGKELKTFLKSREELGLNNVTHIKWVSYEQLPQMIYDTELGLGGPFGNTGQAKRVITGKTFQFFAMAKPVVVGEIDNDYGFRDKVNCLLIPQGDEKKLADAILWCFKNQDKLREVGVRGLNLYRKKFSIDIIKNVLQEYFHYKWVKNNG
jgi:glycosyltransferase involved in cell wall biosynthesis